MTKHSQTQSKNFQNKKKYFNRELSWLEFNNRVLDQAFSDSYPLLERIRFLSFVCSNLDQFYEIRVAGLMQKVDGGSTKSGFDGITPSILLDKIREKVKKMAFDKQACWREILMPALKRKVLFLRRLKNYQKKNFYG